MGKIKRVAGGDQAVVAVEVVIEVVVVQIPALAIPVEVPHVAVAVRIKPNGNMQNAIYTTAPRSFRKRSQGCI